MSKVMMIFFFFSGLNLFASQSKFVFYVKANVQRSKNMHDGELPMYNYVTKD